MLLLLGLCTPVAAAWVGHAASAPVVRAGTPAMIIDQLSKAADAAKGAAAEAIVAEKVKKKLLAAKEKVHICLSLIHI